MRNKIRSRASSLPLNVLCGASLEPGLSIEPGDRDAADLGTATHAVMASWITHGFDHEQIIRVAAATRMKSEDLAPIVFQTWSQWKHLAELFPDPQCELLLEHNDDANGIYLSGHCDVISLAQPPTIRILDFKSGFGDSDATPQIQGYSFLALKQFPDFESVNAGVLRVRENATEGYEWSRQELDDWYTGLVERLNDRTYRPGRHCAYCPRGATCEAKAAVIKQSLNLLTATHMSTVLAKGDRAAALEEILVAARIIQKAAEDAKEIVRGEVRAAGGKLGNLEIYTEQHRKIIMPQALPVLTEVLGDDLEQILEVKKTSLEKLIGDKAPYRGKAAKIREVMGRLEEADAIRMTTQEKLKIRTPFKAIGGPAS